MKEEGGLKGTEQGEVSVVPGGHAVCINVCANFGFVHRHMLEFIHAGCTREKQACMRLKTS